LEGKTKIVAKDATLENEYAEALSKFEESVVAWKLAGGKRSGVEKPEKPEKPKATKET
jgi:hypothetical protein